MMQHQPSWPFCSVMDSTLDQVENYGLINMDTHVGGCEFSSSFTTTEDSSEISSIPYFSTILSSDFVQFPSCDDELVMLPVEDFSLDLEGFDTNLSDPLEGIYGFINESEGSCFPLQQIMSTEGEDVWSPSPSIKSSEASIMDTTTHTQSSLTLPGEDMEIINNHLSVLHLLKAYGESMENEQRELAEVILKCVSEKVSPFGAALERLAFNLSQDVQKQVDYMKQESCKNFEAAFRAIYQILPYGRFAHYAANSAILEAMPDDAETIHIVDFDIGEGVQWPLMIEAMARKQKEVKLTCLKWEEDYNCTSPSQWNFVETKKWLCDHARSFGLKLKVEEMKIDDLVCDIKKMKKRGGKREWLAFNCMVGLPHMGRERSRKLVKEFLQVAKELLTNNRGVITFGDGDACEKLKDCSGFGSFFDECLVHYQALLESMESNFPIHLAEARMVMETLFVAPYISSHAWCQKWEEIREGCNLQAGTTGLEGWKVSKEVLMEAKEMVKDGGGLYGVRIGGRSENEMVLEWKGTPLVIISTWRNQS